MHHLKAGEYTYLAGEINSLYHEAAVKDVYKRQITHDAEVASYAGRRIVLADGVVEYDESA